MKKIYIVAVALVVLFVSVAAVSADDGFSFNFSSSQSSSTDGGSISFENGKLNIQGIELAIPDGYKENESAQKLGEKATDVDAKFSACEFTNGNKDIIVQVFFDDKNPFNNVTAKDGQENKTIGSVNGVYTPGANNTNPTFEYLKDGKIVSISAPDDDTIAKIIK